LGAVDLHEPDLDALGGGGRQVLAHEVGPDGELPVPAVHEDGQAHGGGAAQIGDRVEGGPDGAAGEEDVVHEHDDGAVEGDTGQAVGHRGAGRAAAEVGPVEGDVHLADGGGGVEGRLDAGQQGAQPPGQGRPAARDPHQDEILGALVGLEDLVGDPG